MWGGGGGGGGGEIEYQASGGAGGEAVLLCNAKFRKVETLTLFVGANAGEEDVRGLCRARRPPATTARARGGAKRRIPAPDCMAAGVGTGSGIDAVEPLATPSPKQRGGARVGAAQGVHGACP